MRQDGTKVTIDDQYQVVGLYALSVLKSMTLDDPEGH